MSCWRSFGAAEFLTPVFADSLFCLLTFGAGGCLFWTDVGASAERLVGYYTPKRSHLKIAVLPQCEAFSADFAGRHSICALRRAKITEGERVVPPVVALHRRSISKET